MTKWICTDQDTNQWGRKLSDGIYEFKQDNRYPDGTIETVTATIKLGDYTYDQISDHLMSFGYTVGGLITSLGGEDAEWMMAECIFENEN